MTLGAGLPETAAPSCHRASERRTRSSPGRRSNTSSEIQRRRRLPRQIVLCLVDPQFDPHRQVVRHLVRAPVGLELVFLRPVRARRSVVESIRRQTSPRGNGRGGFRVDIPSQPGPWPFKKADRFTYPQSAPPTHRASVRAIWQSLIRRVFIEHEHRLHAFCWMTNHVHMAAQVGQNVERTGCVLEIAPGDVGVDLRGSQTAVAQE